MASHWNNLEFTSVVLVISALAGFLGSLTGLGGGVVITPALVLLLGVDLRYAIGASLVSVIATSSGAASAYVREGFSNIRIGMFLEIATTVGALFGLSGVESFSLRAGSDFRTCVAVFGLPIEPAGTCAASGSASPPARNTAAARGDLSGPNMARKAIWRSGWKRDSR